MGEAARGDDADVPRAPRHHAGNVLAEGEAATGRGLRGHEAVDPDGHEGRDRTRAVHGVDGAQEGVIDGRLPREGEIEACLEALLQDRVGEVFVERVALRHVLQHLVERLRVVLGHPLDVASDPHAARHHVLVLGQPLGDLLGVVARIPQRHHARDEGRMRDRLLFAEARVGFCDVLLLQAHARASPAQMMQKSPGHPRFRVRVAGTGPPLREGGQRREERGARASSMACSMMRARLMSRCAPARTHRTQAVDPAREGQDATGAP